jgi:hypothetical protein
MTNVMNLKTGETQVFSCAPQDAVVAAYAQSLGDWNTWDYAQYTAEYGKRTVSCGDFCAIQEVSHD